MEEAERRRFAELLRDIERAGEAERAELELYVEQHPELTDELLRRLEEVRLGAGWLARVEADERLQRRERSPRTRLERGVGLGLFGGGVIVGLFSGPVGAAATVSGLAVLLWSFVRQRAHELRDDPYRGIDK